MYIDNDRFKNITEKVHTMLILEYSYIIYLLLLLWVTLVMSKSCHPLSL